MLSFRPSAASSFLNIQKLPQLSFLNSQLAVVNLLPHFLKASTITMFRRSCKSSLPFWSPDALWQPPLSSIAVPAIRAMWLIFFNECQSKRLSKC